MRRFSVVLLILALTVAAFGAKPGTLNITVNQGGTFGPLVLTLKDSDGNAVNLTGYTASAQYRKTYDSSEVLATFTCSIPSPTSGQITISLTDETTAALTAPAQGVWDLFITDASGASYRILAGTVTVLPRVTR